MVDTGQDLCVQIMSHVAEATRAQVKASIATPALSLKASIEMIPFLIVPETFAPTRTAPRNSQIPAKIHACRMLKDREETEVANELGVSTASRQYMPQCCRVTAHTTLTLTWRHR